MTDYSRSEPKVLITYVGKSPQPSGGAAQVALSKAQTDYNKAKKKYEDLTATALATKDPAAVTEADKACNELNTARDKLAKAQADAAKQASPPATPPEAEPVDLMPRLLSFSYEDSEKKTDLCKMVFDNRDLALFDDQIFEKGTVLVVQWGYAERMCPPHEVVVQKVKGALKLSIEAQDKGVLMNKKARSRTFDNMTRADVIKQVAQENGYEADRQFIDDTEVIYPSLSQASQTDAQFLKKLADQEGFEFYVDVDGLHWHARKLDQKPTRVLQYYFPPDVGDILSFDIENDVSGKPGAVTVKGRDPVKKQDFTHTADDANTPRPTTATSTEVPTVTVDPRTGEASKATTSGPAAPPPQTANASTETRPTAETTAAGAKREADGVYRRTQQTAVQLNMDIVGDPDLAAKCIVEVRGLGGRLSGKYYITEAVHTLDGGGYKLKLKTKSDGTNKPSKSGGASAAQPNKKDAPASATPGTDPPKLEPTVTVDPRTGESKTNYKDSRGQGAP